MGNYGHIQYGQQFVGEIQYPVSNRNGCGKFLLSDFEKLVQLPSDMDQDQKQIVLLDHGGCTLVEKTFNA